MSCGGAGATGAETCAAAVCSAEAFTLVAGGAAVLAAATGAGVERSAAAAACGVAVAAGTCPAPGVVPPAWFGDTGPVAFCWLAVFAPGTGLVLLKFRCSGSDCASVTGAEAP
jgi:hypothetical protein